MSIETNWLCYYNAEKPLEQLVYAADATAAVRWFERGWDADWEWVYVWVRPSGIPSRGARLFLGVRPEDPPRAIREVFL